MKDLRNVYRILKKVGEKNNKIIFRRVAEKEKICVVGISDSYYNQEGHSVAGEIILLNKIDYEVVPPLFWKSGIIRKIFMSPKAVEMRGVMRLVDDTVNLKKQLTILMNKEIPLRIFTDSRPLIESIGSSSS